MATIKSFTSLEQSKKLSKFLPLESADMCYIKHSSSDNPTWEFNEDFPPMILGNVPINEMTVEALPCWSLSALLGVLPYGYSSILTKSFNGEDYYCKLDGKPIETVADNPVDACVEMIEYLHELKIL